MYKNYDIKSAWKKDDFNDTVLGELISFYYRNFTNNPNTKHFGRMIASREMLKKSTGNWAITKEGTFSKKP